ncbi:MAG: SUMF1/EgtB/PvdO family nonheme iron enzyme [Candidatus Eisenbacteria bacterium]
MSRLRPSGILGALVVILAFGCGSNSTKPQVEPEPAPAAPAELLATDATVARISLSWRDRSTSETGFRVERRISGVGEFARVDTVAANVGTYNDRTVQAETTYDYRVIAYRGSVQSEPSPTATVVATTNASPTTPNTPSPSDGVQSIPSDSLVVLRWTSTDADGDQLVYDVYFGANRLALAQVAQGQSTSELAVPISLEDNRTYFWRVLVHDPKGVSRSSRVWSFSTPIDRVEIPEGRFVMGDTGQFVHPGNPVLTRHYDLDAYEVTNQQFANFLNRSLESRQVTIRRGTVWDITGLIPYADLAEESVGGIQYGDVDSSIYFDPQDSVFAVTVGRENFPVVQVSWYGADAFAQSISRRLPTESEWEKAARGISTELGVNVYIDRDTLVVGLGYPYPWGEEPAVDFGNFDGSGDPYENFSRVRATPVGFYDGQVHSGYQTGDGASPYGAYDMAGNVWEWTADWFGLYGDPHSPPRSGSFKVVRGSSFDKGIQSARTWNRSLIAPDVRDRTVGFRTAATLTP